MDNIQQYRQPMITATGFFLGFLLNSMNSWLRDAFTVHFARDIILGVCMLISMTFLLLVLVRILRMHYPTDPEVFYRRTLIFFLIGIAIPFVAFLIIMIEKFVIRVSA